MTKKPRSLVVFTPGFAENETDTTCIPALQAFVKTLTQKEPSLRVIVLAINYPFSKCQYVFAGAEVICCGGKNRRLPWQFRAWGDAWMVLRRINKQTHISGILSCWMGECALIGSTFARLYRLKHYTWFFGQDARPGNRILNLIKPNGQNLIALSDWLQQEVFKNYNIMPTHMIPKGIVATDFAAVEYERTIDVIGVGSLITLKRYDWFIDVIGELHQSFPNIRAVICGDGPEKARLLKQIEDLGLQNTITLAGRLQHPEVLNLMMQSRILMHPSSYEGLGMVCLEALCAGAQVLSVCRPFNNEIENWHIAQNKADLVKKLAQLLTANTPPKRVLPFTMEATCEQIMKLF